MKIGTSLFSGARGPRGGSLAASGFEIAMMSDPHVIANAEERLAYVRTALDWIQTTAVNPVALVMGGDLVEAPWNDLRFLNWIYDAEGGGFSRSIPILPAIGNHDAEIPWPSPEYGTTPAQPHASILAAFPQLFRGREWYAWDHQGLRMIFLNDLTDYIQDSGYPAYENCNPPGDFALNPDHSGITIGGSPQRLWLDGVSAAPHPWKILVCHRALWAPADRDSRRLNRLARPATRVPIDNGVSLILQGDIHVGSFSGPWYPTEPLNEEYRQGGSVAAYSLTLAGSYVIRPVDETVLPDHAETCHWASGSPLGASRITHAALLSFQGETADLTIFECSAADPTGQVVHTATLQRNPGYHPPPVAGVGEAIDTAF